MAATPEILTIPVRGGRIGLVLPTSPNVQSSGDGEAAAAVAEGQRRGEEEGSAEAAETIAKSEAAAGRGRSEWEHDALFAAFSKFDRDSRCVNNTEL